LFSKEICDITGLMLRSQNISLAILGALLLVVPAATAQKLKFKLTFQDTAYVGTMNPKWFNEIQITPSGDDPKNLEDADGIMTGDRFGVWTFSIARNTMGTSEDLMIKTSNGWYPLVDVTFKKDKLRMQFDWSFRARATEKDLEVLNYADQLLADVNAWNRDDDRQCDDDAEKDVWSLFCALQGAYLNKTGDYNHRAPALEIVRQNIGLLNPERDYSHRLMDFNNESSFEDIKTLLLICRRKMEENLN